MSVQTHYETMGLAQNALPEVIKAAYKALASIYRADKTENLNAEQRAEHAAMFRAVQEAYDVLGNSKLKAMYDMELDRHAKVDLLLSTFHNATSPNTGSRSVLDRGPSVPAASSEGKAFITAKVEHQLRQAREVCAQGDMEMCSNISDIKAILAIWKEQARKHSASPVESALCHAKIQHYQQLLRQREAERTARRDELASPKGGFPIERPAQPARHTSIASTATTGTPSKAERRQREKEKLAEAEAQRAQDRLAEKARRDAAKQARQLEKQEAVRREKERLQRRADEAAAQKAVHIARVRAKAAPAPAKASEKCSQSGEPSVKTPRACEKCNSEHRSFADWKRCVVSGEQKGEGSDESFFVEI